MENINELFEFLHQNYKQKAVKHSNRTAIFYLALAGILTSINLYLYPIYRYEFGISKTEVIVISIINVIAFCFVFYLSSQLILRPKIDLPEDISKEFITYLRNNVPAPIYANRGIDIVAVYIHYTHKKNLVEGVLLYDSSKKLMCSITEKLITVYTEHGEEEYKL